MFMIKIFQKDFSYLNLFFKSAIKHPLPESDVIEVQLEVFFSFEKFTLKKQDIFNLMFVLEVEKL